VPECYIVFSKVFLTNSQSELTVSSLQIPFCAIGVDHALEHIKRIMKFTGGLVGITQNASARERFFLTAPELSRLAEEAHVMAGSPTTTCKEPVTGCMDKTGREHCTAQDCAHVVHESYEVRG